MTVEPAARLARMPRPARRLLPLTAVVGIAMLAVTACGPSPDPRPKPTASVTPTAEDGAPLDRAAPARARAPDDSLSSDELRTLLRVPATAAVRPETCAPGNLDAQLWGDDVAAGSRFSTIRVTDVSAASCTVSRYPGIGARGEWGGACLIVAEQSPIDSGDETPVTPAPGDDASAPISWTGALAEP